MVKCNFVLTVSERTVSHSARSIPFKSLLLAGKQLVLPPGFDRFSLCALQIKGRWESNINVWFPFINSQKWNCYFQNRIIMFPFPVFPGSVCLFCCREVCGPFLGIYKSITDTWMWKLGLRPHNSQKRIPKMGFSVQCGERAALRTCICCPRQNAGISQLMSRVLDSMITKT